MGFGPTSRDTMRHMDGATIRQWFQRAATRWPAIAWALDRYEVHVGSRSPSHPEDLFLGGAAGERVEQAWVHIDGECREAVIRRVSQVGTAARSADDLWGDAIVKLMTDDPEGPVLADGSRAARIRRFRGDCTLIGYIARMATHSGFDELRREKNARSYRMECQRRGDQATVDPQQAVEQEEIALRLAEAFKRAFTSLPPRRQSLLSLVIGQELPKAAAGKVLGLRDYQVSRELSAAFDALRLALEAEAPGEWTPGMIEFWLRFWASLDVPMGDDDGEHGKEDDDERHGKEDDDERR